MLRPGLHLSNCSPITDADIDICRRWSPLSLLEVMDLFDQAAIARFMLAWNAGGKPEVVVRRYYQPREGNPGVWGTHARESCEIARLLIAAGVPASKLILKPFNEPNMPDWTGQWEGFGDKPEDIEKYNLALNCFIDVAKQELPNVRIGGPSLTVGNRDVKFDSDPPGRYYMGPNSLCQEALSRLDVHFVHCYGDEVGQAFQWAHGLRFTKYEEFLPGKPIYVVEGSYGLKGGHEFRGHETVRYLQLLGASFPQVKGIALWIGGDRGWEDFRFSDGANPDSHRPEVKIIQDALPNNGNDEEEEEDKPLPTELEGAELITKYNLSLERCTLPGFRLVKLQERCEAANCDVWVQDTDGSPIAGQWVCWGWPGTETGQKTDPYGRAGFPMASSAYYSPEKGESGPHWTAIGAIDGLSDVVDGIGMIGGTVHCTVNATFRYCVEETGGNGGDEEEGGDEENGGEVPYKLIDRLVQAPHGFEDARAEIEAFSKLSWLESDRRVFGDLEMAVIHHTVTADDSLPVAIARVKVQAGDVTSPYHFMITPDGKLWWCAKLVYVTPHAAQWNRKAIGIAFVGDFSNKPPTQAAIETCRFLLMALWEFYGQDWGKFRPMAFMPHYMLWNGEDWHTACPGQAWKALTWGDDANPAAWPDFRGSL